MPKLKPPTKKAALAAGLALLAHAAFSPPSGARQEERPPWSGEVEAARRASQELDSPAARAHLNRALEIAHEREATQSQIAEILDRLGMVAFHEDEHEEALDLLETALRLKTEELGANHPSLADTLDRLAEAHEFPFPFREMLPFFERGLELRSKAFGEDSPEAAKSLTRLGSVYLASGDFSTAESYFRQSLEILDLHGATDELTLGTISSLIVSLEKQGRTEEVPALRAKFREIDRLRAMLDETVSDTP